MQEAAMKTKKILRAFLPPKKNVCLAKIPTVADFGPKSKEDAEKQLQDDTRAIDRLQERLYAGSSHAVLAVFQAMDTGGKDGVIRNVFSRMNPQGVDVTPFKKPSSRELAHDYLWRVHAAVPARGMVGVFNRSHFEDVLIARVRRLAPKEEINRRYEQLNGFERYLTENRVVILKFFLHISKDEQKRRLQSRLDNPKKHWKFSPDDVAERGLWEKYQEAYEAMLRHCSTEWAPWRVIPSDAKWFRDWAVARVLRETLEGLNLSWPKAPKGLKKIVIPD